MGEPPTYRLRFSGPSLRISVPPTIQPERFYERLQEIMRERGMTQAKVSRAAKALGSPISESVFTDWKAGGLPTGRKLVTLCRVLKTSPNDLLAVDETVAEVSLPEGLPQEKKVELLAKKILQAVREEKERRRRARAAAKKAKPKAEAGAGVTE